MLHIPIENNEITILLALNDNNEEDNLKEIVLSHKYLDVVVAHNWEDIQEKIRKQKFSVIITRTSLLDENIVQNIHNSDFFEQYETPVIFLLRNQILQDQMIHKGNYMVRFLEEKIMFSTLLNYSIKDLCEQHRYDKERKENEIRYKNLFEHSFDVNLILDTTKIIIEGNEQFRKKIGKEFETPIEHIFIYSSTYKRFIELLNSDTEIKRFKAEILLENEPAKCLIDSFALYNTERKKVGNHLIIRDIDDEYKMQRLSSRANNLLTTGKFMRSLAHEIRNPLTNIQLASEQLRDEMEPTEDSNLFFNIIKRSTSRITGLLTKLMDAYKSSEVKLKEEDLVKIVKKSISLAKDRIALKNIDLKTNFVLPSVMVQADFDKMATAILNLIVNAIEAMDKEEKIIQIKINRSKKGNILLTIEDNAIGMDENQITALFNPFYTGKSKGIGLGLTATQNIILAHNWEIDVKSELGKGSKFTIQI